METAALPLSRLQLPSSSRLTTRLSDFFALMKPRVMLLAVFTALVGLMIAPGQLDPALEVIAILAIATGAGAAGVLNMWYDADIDSVMTRTAKRPIPRGRVSRTEALSFGLALAVGAVAVLGLALNLKAAALLAFAIFFYVVVYTVWLKRSTPQNIVIGGAAGALPPVIGWAAASGEVGVESLIFVPDCLSVDATTLLGARAHARRRIAPPCGRPHVAGRCRKECNRAADPGLQSSFAASFNIALGARLYRRSLRRGRGRLRCDLRGAGGSIAQKPWCQSARSASLVRILHFVPVPVVCCAAGRQHQSIDNDAFHARRCDYWNIASHPPSEPTSNDARPVPGQRRRGLACGTLTYLPS